MGVQSVFNYGIILENGDEDVAKLFDEINLKLDKNHHQAIGSVCVDIMDIADVLARTPNLIRYWIITIQS